MTCWTGFGNLLDGKHPVWVGDFNGNGRTDVLFYYSGDSNWWLGQVDQANTLQWSLVGNTKGFGNLLDGKHPVWVGDFNGNGRTDVLFYYSGDSNWWLGQVDQANTLQWSLVGNTKGFGNLLDGKHPVWVGDFNGNGRTDVLFYYSGDSNWWLGQVDQANTLQWSLVGNTKGFGNLLDGKHPVWVGDFNGNGRTDVLFYYSGDSNWWLGQVDQANTLQWSLVGNTKGFGNLLDGKHPVWVGDFNGNGRTDVLFHYSGDSNWWLGQVDQANTLQWSLVGNTKGFGNLLDGKHPVWVGDFNGNGRTDVLFHYSGDSNWWLGQVDQANTLQWSLVGNTKGFGNLLDGKHPVWVGDFNGNGRTDVAFYYSGDGNWWLGQTDPTPTLGWNLLGNTGRPCSDHVNVAFKTLIVPDQAVRDFIADQKANMSELFSTVGLKCEFLADEDLSSNQALSTLRDLDVGNCVGGVQTAEQVTLFANRNNVGADDLVVYVVNSLQGGAGNFVGCASHPAGQPGAAVVQSSAKWLTAHELGHVLGLAHVASSPATNSDFLMWPNTGWTNVPPDLSSTESTTMKNSAFAPSC